MTKPPAKTQRLSAEIIARARSAVGVRFRRQGQDPASGLDCVGLAALAWTVRAPDGIEMRGGSVETVSGLLVAAGGVAVADAAAGDIALVEAGPAQLHLLVMTETGFIHADARLRRVVEVPGAPQWPVAARFRRRA